MGDRANVYMQERGGGGVYFYTHWGGSDLAADVQKSLTRGRERWTDGPYLGRVIFADLIDGQEKDLTGYGISASIGDNEHAIIVVDAEGQRVGFAPEPTEEKPTPEPARWWSFTEFIALTASTLRHLWDEADQGR